ncbi:MAG: hypothetical protein DRI24_22240 [Deltaproteobacteria bacterium]|nr:MAG: hypothetical protein DRI24_22240 [Deltaproteobacteria bacterium]
MLHTPASLSQAICLIIYMLSNNSNTRTGGSILAGIDGSREPVFAPYHRFCSILAGFNQESSEALKYE